MRTVAITLLLSLLAACGGCSEYDPIAACYEDCGCSAFLDRKECPGSYDCEYRWANFFWDCQDTGGEPEVTGVIVVCVKYPEDVIGEFSCEAP